MIAIDIFINLAQNARKQVNPNLLTPIALCL